MTTIEPPTSPELLETSSGPYDREMKEAGQLTSPTWELELFLSGAFVFATFQLPGLIEQLFARLEPHATETTYFVLFNLSLYGKAIAFTLIAMFAVHLITRAYWVALMGLHSVFPRGVRWEEMKVGPIAKRVFAARDTSLPPAIAKLDNICSVVFSVGLLIVLLFVYTTLLAGAMAGTAYGLALAFTHGQNMRYFFLGLAVPLMVVPIAATLIDRRIGGRVRPGSRLHWVLDRVLRFSYALNLQRLTGPMTWTLASNLGRRKWSVFLIVALTGFILLSSIDRLANSNALSINSYDFFGLSRDRSVNYRFYEDKREAGKPYPRTPSIQSDIIRDPYAKLFIPYYVRRDNDAVARFCPAVKRLHDRGIQLGGDSFSADSLVVPVLDCLARLRAVSLDGAPRPDLKFSFYENPATGIKGIITYIPVDSLARGRHTIGLMPVPPAVLPTDSVALAEWKKPTVIQFWK